jgi:Type I restriction modification DNA specificity domain
LNYFIAQFLVPLIKKQMGKFNWGGNGATLTRLRRSKILLPITPEGKPDYVYMENYIKKIEFEKLSRYLEIKQKSSLLVNN